MEKIKGIYRKFAAKVPELGVIIFLVLLMAFTQIVNPAFLTVENMTILLKSIPFIALASLGGALCLLTGTLDIALGRVAGLCGMIFGYALVKMGMSLTVSILLGVAVGAAFGIVHAILIVHAGINAFIVTMGTLYISGGFRYLVNNGDVMALPDYLRGFTQQQPLGVSWLFWIVAIIFVIVGFVQSKTVYGRRMYAVGNNKEVARLQGINTKFIQDSILILSGIFAGMAGVMATIDINSAQPATGTGWEFKAVAASFLGGTSLAGGTGRAFGTAIGVFIVFVVNNVINMIHLPAYWNDVFTGGVLIGSVLLDVYRKSRKIHA